MKVNKCIAASAVVLGVAAAHAATPRIELLRFMFKFLLLFFISTFPVEKRFSTDKNGVKSNKKCV